MYEAYMDLKRQSSSGFSAGVSPDLRSRSSLSSSLGTRSPLTPGTQGVNPYATQHKWQVQRLEQELVEMEAQLPSGLAPSSEAAPSRSRRWPFSRKPRPQAV